MGECLGYAHVCNLVTIFVELSAQQAYLATLLIKVALQGRMVHTWQHDIVQRKLIWRSSFLIARHVTQILSWHLDATI